MYDTGNSELVKYEAVKGMLIFTGFCSWRWRALGKSYECLLLSSAVEQLLNSAGMQ